MDLIEEAKQPTAESLLFTHAFFAETTDPGDANVVISESGTAKINGSSPHFLQFANKSVVHMLVSPELSGKTERESSMYGNQMLQITPLELHVALNAAVGEYTVYKYVTRAFLRTKVFELNKVSHSPHLCMRTTSTTDSLPTCCKVFLITHEKHENLTSIGNGIEGLRALSKYCPTTRPYGYHITVDIMVRNNNNNNTLH
jgi:hypothetical protein